MNKQKFSINNEESVQEYALRKQLIAKDEQLAQANQRIAELEGDKTEYLVVIKDVYAYLTKERMRGDLYWDIRDLLRRVEALQPKDEA